MIKDMQQQTLPISFSSCEFTLRGWLVKPFEADQRLPAIVIAPGFSAVKEGAMRPFISDFVAAGFAVLAYDNINFGESDGPLRQEVDPTLQKRGYQDAITYLTTREDIDPNRIGIWGSSYSGGHVLSVAAVDRRVKCVVAQAPYVNGLTIFSRMDYTQREQLLAMFAADRIARASGQKPRMIRAVSSDSSEVCTMPGEGPYRHFIDQWEQTPNWRNEVTLRSVEYLRTEVNDAFMSFISPTPLLVIVPARDEIIGTAADLALRMYQRALEPKKIVILDSSHFEIYDNPKVQSQAGAAAVEWFQSHL